MKKLIAILLTASFGFTGAAYAKPDDARKKSKGPQQHAPQQHVNANVNAGPKNKMKVHQNTPNVNSANVNPAKIQKKKFHQQKKEFRKTNVVEPQTNPMVQSKSLKKHPTELPAIQKNVVNPHNTANVQLNRAKYKNFQAQRSSSIASAQF